MPAVFSPLARALAALLCDSCATSNKQSDPQSDNNIIALRTVLSTSSFWPRFAALNLRE